MIAICYYLLKQGTVECKHVNVPTSMCFQKDSHNFKFYIRDFNCNIHLPCKHLRGSSRDT